MKSTQTMTIEEAAEALNVSAEYVSNLLDEGNLLSLSSEDVAAYKHEMDKNSQAALDELAKIAQENDMGY